MQLSAYKKRQLLLSLPVGTPVVTDSGREGVIAEGGSIFMRDGQTERKVKLSTRWRPKDVNQALETVARLDETDTTPLSESEQLELNKLEFKFETIRGEMQSASLTLGHVLNEIKAKKLYREYGTFEDYAQARFNLHNKYVYHLMQNASYTDVAKGSLQISDGVIFSVNMTQALTRQTNKLSELVGLGKIEFEAVRPVIHNTLRLLVDTAPRDRFGKPILSPLVVTKFNEILRSHVQDGVVEIEGVQMTLAEAKEQNLLNATLQNEVVEAVVEAIKVKKDYIIDEFQKKFERMTAPVFAQSANFVKDIYEGPPVVCFIECSRHGNTSVKAIGNGTIQLECLCRFRVDADTGNLTVFETEGQRVVAFVQQQTQ